MAKKKISRQAATSKGTLRRVADARLERVSDTREPTRVVFPLGGVLQLIVGGIASGANSLRAIETRSEQLGCHEREVWGLPDARVADNTMGAMLRTLNFTELRACLHHQIKAEHRRGRLQPTRFADDLRVVAIDGKVLSTLRWRDLVEATLFVLQNTEGAPALAPDFVPTVDDVKTVFARRFPEVQLVERKEGTLHGLIRTHRATLVSADAAVCLDVRPIPGATNEIGAMPEVIEQLHNHYGRTDMVDMITADAGNTSLAVATAIISKGWDYFLCIKEPQGGLYQEAVRLLDGPSSPRPTARTEYRRDGSRVVHEVQQVALPDGYLGWTHARQLIRVVRTVTANDGTTTTGQRYYVCSQTRRGITAEEAIKLSRYHWRCENDGHWTSDAILEEDARRTVGSRHPVGMLVFALLRMIAQNVMAVLRATSITDSKTRPTWKAVGEHILKAVFPYGIESSVFDDVQSVASAA